MRKPFYFSQKKCWYVKDSRGRAIRLDPDEGEAYRIWQEMRDAATSLNHPRVTLASIVDAWLSEFEPRLSEHQFYRNGNYLAKFVEHVGLRTIAAEITPATVLTWVRSQIRTTKQGVEKPWAAHTKRDAIYAVTRVFIWAHDSGYLRRNPLASLKNFKPRARVRTITESEHALLIRETRKQKCNGSQFAIYLIASRCGARPQQIREVKVENVHQSGQCWVFQKHKTDKDGKPLFVYLSPCLQTLTRILMTTRKEGHLFVQQNGRKWSKDTVARRLRRLCEQLGLDSSIIAYSYRHTFATKALLSGVPIATVAELLGHKDIRMVCQVYGHLDQHREHLAKAVAQVHSHRTISS